MSHTHFSFGAVALKSLQEIACLVGARLVGDRGAALLRAADALQPL
jgi:hypothetical protein